MTLVHFDEIEADLDELRAIRWKLIDQGDYQFGRRLDGVIGRMHDARIHELRQQILSREPYRSGDWSKVHLRVVADE